MGSQLQGITQIKKLNFPAVLLGIFEARFFGYPITVRKFDFFSRVFIQ